MQAASGGRRKVPLVATLEGMAEDPKVWFEEMMADADDLPQVNTYGLSPAAEALGVLRYMINELHRVTVNGQEAGTALGFNVNREWVGH